jgi:ribose transport system permease protein
MRIKHVGLGPPNENGTPPDSVPADAELAPGRSRRHTLQAILERYAVLGALVLVFVLFSVILPGTFPTHGNLIAMLNQAEVTLFLAIGVTITLRLGDLDLSFGATAITSAALLAELNVNLHWPVYWAIAAALAFGVAAGAINALLVVGFRLNAFVATLGTMTLITGLGYGVVNSNVISGVSPGLSSAVRTSIGGVPVGVTYGWILAIIVWAVYEFTPFGRYLLFIGGNRNAARLLGLPVARVRVIAYLVSGALFALGGIILTGYLGSADPSIGPQYLLAPLAGAFLGTTVVQIGRFNVIGTVIGLYILVAISTGLELLGASAWVGDVFNGGALVGAVGFARLVQSSREQDASLF